jgi:hypothetical protein
MGRCGNQKSLSSHSSLISHRYQRPLRGDQPQGYSGFAIGIDRSQGPFRGFLPRKTTPRDLYQATVIAKPL